MGRSRISLSASCSLLAAILALGFLTPREGQAQGDAKPTMISEAIARQMVKVRVEPEYPATARQFHIAGEVQAQITIGADGKVESTDELKGNLLLQSAVKSVIRKWLFTPYLVDGKPVRVRTSLIFNFRL